MERVYYNYDTKNQSFINVANQLKQDGVNNYDFMLLLYDKSIKNLDPYDKNLTEDEINKIKQEVYYNPWYFLREIVRIPSQDGTAIRYKANRGNIAQAWCSFCGISSFVSLPRQTYKTMSSLWILIYFYILHLNHVMNTYYHADKFVDYNIIVKDEHIKKIVKELVSSLPYYLKYPILKNKDNLNLSSFHYIYPTKIIYNEISKSININPRKYSVIYCDDAEFISNIKDIYDTINLNKKMQYSPFLFLATSILNNYDHNGVQSKFLIENSYKFNNRLYDLCLNDIYNILYLYNMVHISFTYEELGYDTKYIKKIIDSMGENNCLINGEILLKRTDKKYIDKNL